MAYLESYGITDRIRAISARSDLEGVQPARIITGDLSGYRIITEQGEFPAQITGKFEFNVQSSIEFPVAGDWVATTVAGDQAVIHELIPRFAFLARKSAGRSSESQILAANVDTVFIVQGLDQDFNPRRLERYLVMAYDGGVQPVVLLSKRDLRTDKELRSMVKAAERTTGNIPVLPYSVLDTSYLEVIQSTVKPRKTFCLVGSSGVGKSTLINRLLGESRLPTQAVREKDSRGLHTTSRRELILLDGDIILIDTPGMRELGIAADRSSLQAAFPEIDSLAPECRYRDCQHDQEPDCAVRAAVAAGTLPEERYDSYLKLAQEMAYHATQTDELGRRQHKRAQKIFSKHIKQWKSKL